MKAGSIFGKLPIPINEIEDLSIPRQLTDRSCGIACGQMLLESTGIRVSHSQIVAAAGDDFLTADELTKALRELSGANWQRDFVFPSKENLDKFINSAIAVQLVKGYFKHWVVLDGYNRNAEINVRDPLGLKSTSKSGTSYSIEKRDFLKFWNGYMVRLQND